MSSQIAAFSCTTFFAYARRAPFGGRLTQAQVDGMTAIIAQPWEDKRHLAYALATAFHETAATMQPVRETLAKSDKGAIAALDKAFRDGRLKSVRTPYWRDGFFGRGFSQLTHEENYRAMSPIVGVDLVANPSKALDPQIAATILFEGMTRGSFTGRKLKDYFNSTVSNPEAARAIINGKDKAKLIAGYYANFLDAIDAGYSDQPKSDVTPLMARPDDVPVSKSWSLRTIVTGVVGGGGLGVAREVMDSGSGLLGAISNPWAFASLALLVTAVCVGAWLLATGRVTINRSHAP